MYALASIFVTFAHVRARIAALQRRRRRCQGRGRGGSVLSTVGVRLPRPPPSFFVTLSRLPTVVVCHTLLRWQGLDVAQTALGALHEEGSGVVEDKAEALRWYRLAAEQGLADAIFRVAVCCESGWGEPADRSEVVRLCKLALESDAGHVAAADLLRSLGA